MPLWQSYRGLKRWAEKRADVLAERDVSGSIRAWPVRFAYPRSVFSSRARAISYVGTYLAPIAVAFAVLDNGGGATAVGLSFAAWTLAQVAMLAFGGVVGDRVPRRLVMIGSDIASTVVRATMGVLLVTGHAAGLAADRAPGLRRRRGRVLLARVLRARARGRAPEDELQQANGLLAIARYAAFPLGAAVGGTIVALSGRGRPCSSTPARTARAPYSSRGSTSSRSPAQALRSSTSCATAGVPSSSRRGYGYSSSTSRSTS